MNLYGFANGDPINFADPFGLCPEDKGGDGKTDRLDDCPEDSDGAKEHQQAEKEKRRAAVASCFARNTAWMNSENAFVAGSVGVFGGAGATLGDVLGQAAGREQIMRGTVSLDLFFGTRGASSGLVEGGISSVNAGKSLVATGRGLVRGGLVTLAAQAAFVGTYLATTGALCSADPDY